MAPNELVLAYDESELVTLDVLAERTDTHPELILSYVEYGLIEPVGRRGTVLLFEVAAVARVRTIQRLRNDLGVNLPGVGVILELLERIRELERELQQLRASMTSAP